jgi:hypothetical protein
MLNEKKIKLLKEDRRWLLQLWRGVEPLVHGPFDTEAHRLALARKLRRDSGPEDGLFRMNCPSRPMVGVFLGREIK